MKYAVGMSSGAMIYRPGFINIDSGIQKLIAGIRRHTDSMANLLSLLLFFKIRKLD
jgi:hypothetical protein